MRPRRWTPLPTSHMRFRFPHDQICHPSVLRPAREVAAEFCAVWRSEMVGPLHEICGGSLSRAGSFRRLLVVPPFCCHVCRRRLQKTRGAGASKKCAHREAMPARCIAKLEGSGCLRSTRRPDRAGRQDVAADYGSRIRRARRIESVRSGASIGRGAALGSGQLASRMGECSPLVSSAPFQGPDRNAGDGEEQRQKACEKHQAAP